MPPDLKTIIALEQRAAGLREALPHDEKWISVYCATCGRIEGAPSVHELLPAIGGWKIGDEANGNDRCPACRKEEAGWAGSFPKRRTG